MAGPLMCSCMGYGYVVKGAGLFRCLIIVLKIAAKRHSLYLM